MKNNQRLFQQQKHFKKIITLTSFCVCVFFLMCNPLTLETNYLEHSGFLRHLFSPLVTLDY